MSSGMPFSLLFFCYLQSLSLIQAFASSTNSSDSVNIFQVHIANLNLLSSCFLLILDWFVFKEFNLRLQDVLNEISARKKWDLEGIRVSEVDVNKARFGTAQNYEFQIRLGKKNRYVVFIFPGEVSSWKKLKEGEAEANFESLVRAVGSEAVLDPFKIEGPFELRVDGDDELSLLLPMNISHTSLKRILVGEGITVEVNRAQEASYFHSSDLSVSVNGSDIDRQNTGFWPFWEPFCTPLIPVHISGAASLVAYGTRNPNAFIETSFLSKDTIELRHEKCYCRRIYNKLACPVDTMGSRLAMLEKTFRRFPGNRVRQYGLPGHKGKVKASTIIRFQLKLERTIRSNESRPETLAEWRTSPPVERLWFEVMARVEAERLKPISIKKVRPFTAVDTVAWSNLMSNISFTKFPPILVPPEALTLDVKW
ncbi:hypothetical protein HS088_TW11G00796 [Tripterygium wilfordii]|uniref:Uncharacterized protein n=1 Tax=Tripterygium wilfordii TaxID=458696 RepID=A0A7J7D388_TRIWF|nr:hypothetical protein HS088_TW11G00796 [Tripterygium wilfordii]